MEISRLTFTKETKERMNKGRNKRQAGELRFKRLKEADEEGTLAQVKTRMGVAKLGGYTEDNYKTGYSWVTNLINRGHLSETIRGFDDKNRPEYEYHIIGTPVYKIHKTSKKNVVEETPAPVLTDNKPTVNGCKIEITKDGMTMKIELPTAQDLISVVTNVLVAGRK